ncbi:M28 family peptidase [Phycisphaerales bacterium AB-hyl4]|uniref:M28 family peptidase n=1 Tax=Natronomicrosphaera hydrolytica TaxID=3242702 RepID=A0ABV4U4Q5_9BACT
MPHPPALPLRWLTLLAAACTLAACAGPSIYRHADDATAEQFQTYVDHLAHPDMEGRGVGYAGLDVARDYLVDYYTTLGLEPAYRTADDGELSYIQPFSMAHHPHLDHGVERDHDADDVPHDLLQTTAHNVAGYIPGRGALADEIIVIGAHYDHLGYGEVGSLLRQDDLPALHPGADDNASGTAGMMLLAERAMQRAADHPEHDRRTLLFVGFSGEEWGLIGSMHMVNHPDELAVDFDQIVAMINLDMVGRLDRELTVFGLASGDRWRELLITANRGLGMHLIDGGGGIGMSDQTSFYVHRIPVLHFFTGIHEDYHRPTDTADRINAPGGALVVQLIDRLTTLLEREPERMAFTGTGDPHAGMRDAHGQPMQGIGRAQLGVIPDYTTLDGEQGAGITATMPDSPAERVGLEPGDLIKQWNDEPVHNVRTLTTLLRDAEPGDPLTLIIERNGETLTLELELGER